MGAPVRRRLLAVLAVVLVAAAAAGCSTAPRAPADVASRPIEVAATTGMVADAVTNIGGSRVRVTGLMGPGVDPHLYRPTAGDVATLGGADLVVYSGLHLEGRMVDLFEGLDEAGTATVAMGAGIDPARLRYPSQFQGQPDPHVWFDVNLWGQAVHHLADGLVELDPGSADVYRANETTYLAQLGELDGYVHARADELSERSRVLVTAHDAFGYFGREYGFEVRGLQGTSTAAEAGAGDVVGLAGFLCERDIRAVFVESSIPRSTVEAVQKASQARGCQVDVGGQLFSDAMGDAGTPEGTYLGMVRHNIDTIVDALSLE